MAALNQIKPPEGFILDTQQEIKPPAGFILDTPKPPEGFILDRKVEVAEPKRRFDIRQFLPMQYPAEFAKRYFPAEERAIQKVQRFIEPTPEALAKAKRPLLTEFPKFLASEAISMYKSIVPLSRQDLGVEILSEETEKLFVENIGIYNKIFK